MFIPWFGDCASCDGPATLGVTTGGVTPVTDGAAIGCVPGTPGTADGIGVGLNDTGAGAGVGIGDGVTCADIFAPGN